MTQEQSRQEGLAPRDPQAPDPDSGEPSHTADELASYTASRLQDESAPPPHGDPLTDPLDGSGRPVPEAAEQPRSSTEPQATHRPPAPADPPAVEPAAAAPAPDEDVAEPGVRRFMTATDFLDRRADRVDRGPATWLARPGPPLDRRRDLAADGTRRARARAAAQVDPA